ncbi:MAG: DUF2723 domain-containing protein [bacterium]
MKTRIISLVLFISVFSVYLYHMCPTVSEGDSGEFITAAVNLSIPHAPSYPLYTAAGKIVENIIPWGNAGYRINLMSVIFASCAVVFVFLILQVWGAGIIGALLGSLCLAFSSDFFENAVVAEVFGLHAMLAALIFYIIAATSIKDMDMQRKGLYLAAFVSGLAASNHQTILFIGPGLLIWFIAVHTETLKSKQVSYMYADTAVCGIFFMLGLCMYFSLMIRSLKDPFLDWSNPENMSNLWRVFTRADYGSFSLTLGDEAEVTVMSWIRQMMRYVSALIHEFSIVGLCLGIAGFIGMLAGNTGKKLYLVISIILCFISASFVFLSLANMPFTSEAAGIMGRFYIMPSILFVLGIGYVCRGITGRWFSKISALLLILPVMLLMGNQKHYSRRDFFIVYDYSKNILASLPNHAVLFIDGGDDTFYSLAYATHVLNLRKDLDIHDRGGLIFPNPYGSDFRRIGKENKPGRRQKIESAVLNSNRPLYYSTMNWKILEGARLYHAGILMKAQKKDVVDASCNMWPLYRLRGLYPCRWASPIYRVRALLPFFDFLRGVYEFELKNIDAAILYFKRAFHDGNDIQWLKLNSSFELLTQGYAFFKTNDFVQAKKIYQLILEINPQDHQALVNLGVVAEREGDLDRSADYYLQSIKIKPEYVDAHYNLAVIYWQQQEWEKVVQELRTVLHYNPDHRQAQQYLTQALSRKNKQ